MWSKFRDANGSFGTIMIIKKKLSTCCVAVPKRDDLNPVKFNNLLRPTIHEGIVQRDTLKFS